MSRVPASKRRDQFATSLASTIADESALTSENESSRIRGQCGTSSELSKTHVVWVRENCNLVATAALSLKCIHNAGSAHWGGGGSTKCTV